eukprot:TRINITY_DN7135_c0_g1_i1.p1 TRINITY_DN7135_c0_g1~~TRINITY_DN7135_c0_g1_i1.p1  ORF type:complete len:683 (-),score=173.47 TRINITY_DN7135_c0_g1_i1:480-2375(-)
MNSLGSHFLTDPDELEESIGKIEVETMPIEVVVKKKDTLGLEGDKKVCLWPLGSGLSCGKTFTKFDNLKRHLAEAHKGSRPFACNLCDKSYGRKDYLQRHLKSHGSAGAVTASSGGTTSEVVLTSGASKELKTTNHQATQNIILQVHTSSGMNSSSNNNNVLVSPSAAVANTTTNTLLSSHLISAPPQLSTNNQIPPLPMFNVQLTGGPISKPGGSKICRWVQADGTVCGKAFSKLDSLRRHVTELHKGVRPYACNLCDKNYGRRDYLERHMRTHDASLNAHKRKVPMDWGPNAVPSCSTDGTSPQQEQHLQQQAILTRIPKKKRKDIPAEEKKICLWVLEDGTACGKTFTKFDSLKRHVSEAHKGIRPYACTLCGKNYGRRDYLLRHLKSHNEDTGAVGMTTSQNTTSQLVGTVVGRTNSGLSFATSPTLSSQGGTVIQTVSASPHQLVRNSSSHTTLMSIENNPPPAAAVVTSSVSSFSSNTSSSSQIHSSPPHHHHHHSINNIPTTATATIISSQHNLSPPKKRLDDKKTCRWVLDNGTVCGRNFSKFDSLRRHVQELHKGIRPFVCLLCDKSYGRRDYLQRHMKSHDNDGSSGGGAGSSNSTLLVTNSIGGGVSVAAGTPATVVVTQ